MLVLGIESSCDETGVALYDTSKGLLAQQLHTQMSMHAEYGGVVPELASRDHIRRVVPLTRMCCEQAGIKKQQLDAIAYTAGPGLGGALLVGASFANALAFGLNVPVVPVHHLEGHLLSPLLSENPPHFPFIALLVSGGHTQFMSVEEIGRYTLLGETLDDAAGEAFDKTAKLLGLPYPGGARLSELAQLGNPDRFHLPRPMLKSGDLEMSFSGLKTAVLTLVKQQLQLDDSTRNGICRAFQDAIVDVLTAKAHQALQQQGMDQLVVAGGVGANQQLREGLNRLAKKHHYQVFYPPVDLCTDNGAMIAFAGAMRLSQRQPAGGFAVYPRWELTNQPEIVGL